MFSVKAISRWAVGALTALLLFPAILHAAPPPQQGSGGARGGPGPGGEPPVTPEEVREAMQYLMIARLKKALQLTPEQEQTVIPQINGLMEARRGFAGQRHARMASLRVMVHDPAADEGEIGRTLGEIREIEQEYRGREEELRNRINAELTPRQQARLLFFERHFRGAMQKRLREAFGRGAGMRPNRGGARGGARGGYGQQGPRPERPRYDEPYGDFEDWN